MGNTGFLVKMSHFAYVHSTRTYESYLNLCCGIVAIYCTISINSSATVTPDAPDENMVSSGGWNDRDKYKFSSGSRFFYFIFFSQN